MPNVALEAHKQRGGRLRTGHREAARGLPATERLLKPVQNASRCLRKPIRREEAGFGQATEKPQEACRLPRGRPASCREEGKAAVRLWGAFEAGPKCLTLPSEAHKKRGGRLRTGHREAARGLLEQRGRKRPANCREAFEAGPKCLTLPSEAHKKRGGRLRAGHREAARGLPAAERLLKPVQNVNVAFGSP